MHVATIKITGYIFQHTESKVNAVIFGTDI